MNILQMAQVEFSREPIEVVAKYGPFLTPIMPASMAVAGMAQSGQNTMMGGFSIVPALASGLGMEATGYLAAHLLIKSIRKKDILSGFLSFAFLIAYAGFAIHAMEGIQNAGMFQAFVGMSVVTYLGAGVFTRMQTADQEAENKRRQEASARADELERKRQELALYEQAQEIERRKLEMGIELERERTKQVRAQAKAQAFGAEPRPRSSVRANTDEQTNNRLNAERLALVAAALAKNPSASVRDICRECNISSTDVASRYMAAALKGGPK